MVEREGIGHIALRRGAQGDREELIRMYCSFEPKAAAFGLPPRGDRLEPWIDFVSRYPNFVVVAEARIVGHAILGPDGPSAEVSLFVHQDFRRRGLGKRLLGALIMEARRLGLRRLWEVTEPANVSMLRLARSLGFVRSGEGEFHLDLERLPEVGETEIRRRAYEIYLTRDRAPGRALEDWLTAERELRERELRGGMDPLWRSIQPNSGITPAKDAH